MPLVVHLDSKKSSCVAPRSCPLERADGPRLRQYGTFGVGSGLLRNLRPNNVRRQPIRRERPLMKLLLLGRTP
jgi:hypothetical protein